MKKLLIATLMIAFAGSAKAQTLQQVTANGNVTNSDIIVNGDITAN